MDVTNKHTALARIRKKSGLTQLQIADSLGVSKATYSAWETGRAKLGEDRIVALCDLFGCTPNDILGYNKDPDGSPAFFTAQLRKTNIYRSSKPCRQTSRPTFLTSCVIRQRPGDSRASLLAS